MRTSTKKQTGELIKKSLRTLDDWAKKGIGPVPFKIGGTVVYDTDEVENFIEKLKANRPKKK
jgi:predicted DNA-binding transcriptional regulator AlpA